MALPLKLWARAKNDYEAGMSIVRVGLKHDIARKSIEMKIIRDKWVKNALQPIIEDRFREKFIEKMAERGIDDAMATGDLKKLLTNRNAIAKNNGLTQYAKIKGVYATEKHEIDNNTNVVFFIPQMPKESVENTIT